MKSAFSINWLPWKIFTRYVTQVKGFVDPVALYAQVQRFSQPSEVGEPIELLRAGMVFHARGLLNSKVIQHNLDWVWPYWVERQFDPNDASFLPRAFSITHVNLTHRNWTALGWPGLDANPIVDPRGLLTPFWDSWSLDVWAVENDGSNPLPEMLLPSRELEAVQTQSDETGLSVKTQMQSGQFDLTTHASVVKNENGYACQLKATLFSEKGGWLVISARPCNPEGVSFIHSLKMSDDRKQWLINGKDTVKFDKPIELNMVSNYEHGDVHIQFADAKDTSDGSCHAGMLTGAALFTIPAGGSTQVVAEIPLVSFDKHDAVRQNRIEKTWSEAREQAAVLKVANKRVVELYKAARDTLILLSPDEVYAGPYTYRRYWYRDTVFIAHGLLCAGMIDRVSEIVDKLSIRQNRNGYFHSQEGEWDSNGQVLWLMNRFVECGGDLPKASLKKTVVKGAEWIIKKRRDAKHGEAWAGLLPAGFSAEHLGPNDHYYWDNYWSIAGLHGAANLMALFGDEAREKRYREEAEELEQVIYSSVNRAQNNLPYPAIPAAPTRRLDAGAIGSVVASYPLKIVEPNDEKLLGTLEYLISDCFHAGGFFQDMIHSGVNAYLTLHVAQALLRAGDDRYVGMIESVVEHSSPTGHWPEAVHPHTQGGCMGDGHHAWAAAEWIAMIRNCFVREEDTTIILGSGLQDSWLAEDLPASFGPILTTFGNVTVTIVKREDACEISWDASWRTPPSKINIAIPGYHKVELEPFESHSCIQFKKGIGE